MRLIIIFTIVFSLAGCGPETVKTTQSETPEVRINRLLDNGEYRLAAEETLRLAQLYPNNAVNYQQKATEIYLEAGEASEARAVLEIIKTDDPEDRFLNQLLEADLALLENQPARALMVLSSTPPAGTANHLILRYYETRIRAFNSQDNVIDAIKDRINMSSIIESSVERDRNNHLIWQSLNMLSLPTLKQFRMTSGPALESWIELAIINQSMFFKPELLEQSITMWREQYPQHPANTIIDDEILLTNPRINIRPTHIALCLPLSLYEMESQAIRDGFLAAWFATSGFKPEISIYDSDALTINAIYSNAIENGADFVVGPLEKNAVAGLLSNSEIKVTTLALNQIDSPDTEKIFSDSQSPVPRLIQFGLSPEDEARQVANRAFSQGHKRALIITPNSNWGQRLYEAFRGQWETSGGKVMEYVRFPENSEDYKIWVKSLLNVNSSEKRSADLRAQLSRSIKTENRLRGDADMIFMATNSPLSARRIVPEFRFYQTNIPIYSTSHIYTGIVNPQQDKDMDGVRFTQMPWILDEARQESYLQREINKNWYADKSTYRRYYALGIDAYRLIPNLGRLAVQNTVNFPGETGELSLTEDGHIQRKLMWAKFSQGRPELLDK